MPIVVVKIGTFEHPAKIEDLEHLEDRLAKLKESEDSLNDTTFFVTRHDIEFDRYSLNPSDDSVAGPTDLMSMFSRSGMGGMPMPNEPITAEVNEATEEEAVEEASQEEQQLEDEVRENLPIVPDLDNLEGEGK